MTPSHHRSLAAALLLASTASVGCAAADDSEHEPRGSTQDLVGTSRSQTPEQAFDRLTGTFSKALYDGQTPDGDACTLTVSRDNANHLVDVSMMVFSNAGSDEIGFAVHPKLADGRRPAAISYWTDRTISLDFDVNYPTPDMRSIDAHVRILSPKHAPTSLRIAIDSRTVECANLKATVAPLR